MMDLKLASGVAEVLALDGTFADPDEAATYWNEGAEEIPTEDLIYPGAEGQDQRLRLYRGGDENALSLVYIHGGGWAGGSIELHDRSARGLALQADCNVISISYRLSPRHPYPAGLMDCLAAIDWVEGHGATAGLNPSGLVIGGASAGGNLAAAAALARPGNFRGLLVFYGVLGSDLNTDSYLSYADGPGLTRARMAELFEMYDPDQLRGRDPLIAPLLSDRLSDLPPTCVIAAEHDVLLDDNRAFVAALAEAAVQHEFHIEPGVTHGFINRGRLVPAADASIERAAAFLRAMEMTE